MITTPNPDYDGRTMGIPFEGGRAFVGKSHPQAEFVVGQLEHDFGYRVTPMTAKEFKALAPVAPKPVDPARAMLDSLTTPRMVG